MDDLPEDDPWNTPDVHKNHDHAKPNGARNHDTNGHTSFVEPPPVTAPVAPPTVAQYASPPAPAANGGQQTAVAATAPAPGGWGYFDGNNTAAGGFGETPQSSDPNPFGGPDRTPSGNPPPGLQQHQPGGRTGHGVEENVIVTLMPEKEGMFMFQHHNYEVASLRRGSKVIRRYSDFVWLLDCLHKRYPFRILPLLPPKRMGVNGSHLSNDGAFIEKRRRGLARFLNALVRHPVLSQEQMVIMFLTVPTVCCFHLFNGVSLTLTGRTGTGCLAQTGHDFCSRRVRRASATSRSRRFATAHSRRPLFSNPSRHPTLR